MHGIKYIAIHDCIYESFPENYKGHELHRALYVESKEGYKARESSNNNGQ